MQLRCDAVFMTSSPSSSPRFSLLAVIFRTTMNKITSRRFHQHLKKHLCVAVVESDFTFSFSPLPQLSQYHRPNPRSKPLSPCSIKTTQYRVRKCVHESKPRATNRSRVNPITVQCNVGNCYLQSGWSFGCNGGQKKVDVVAKPVRLRLWSLTTGLECTGHNNITSCTPGDVWISG